MSLGRFEYAAPIYVACGWPPFPIVDGGKGATPGGVTGREGVDLEGDRLAKMMKLYRCNTIAVRAPIGPDFQGLGVDVDHYADKRGGDTLKLWKEKWGPLPKTYVSTSRRDGVSGIRWFKVPLGWVGEANHPGIELVQRHHRQAVVAPSLHEKRQVSYFWYAEHHSLPPMYEAEFIKVPWVSDLPWFPDKYLENLKDDVEYNGQIATDDEDVKRLRTEGAPCQAVWRELEKYEHKTKGLGLNCHDTMCSVQIRLLRLGEQEHEGVDAAMDALYDQFEADRGSVRDTATEFNNAQDLAVSKILANPTPDDKKGCCAKLIHVKELTDWLGQHETITENDLAHWLGRS
jgi:putative DNA primase/helicase